MKTDKTWTLGENGPRSESVVGVAVQGSSRGGVPGQTSFVVSVVPIVMVQPAEHRNDSDGSDELGFARARLPLAECLAVVSGGR